MWFTFHLKPQGTLSVTTELEITIDLHFVIGFAFLILDLILWSQVALAYNEAVSSGRLTSSGGFVQSIFLASLRKRCEEILHCSTELKINLRNYLTTEAWPDDCNSKLQKDIIILSWYLKWFSVPSPSIIKAAVEKIKSKSKNSTSAIPLLRLLLPSTHVSAISEIDRVFFSSNETTELWRHDLYSLCLGC